MLNSLTIRNFRSLKKFDVEKLGRVNLIVGKNNSGKSSVLEAIRIYAGNANISLLQDIALGHDEKAWLERNEPEIQLPFEDFFSGRHFPEHTDEVISIGDPQNPNEQLTIDLAFLKEHQEITTDKDTGETKTTIHRRIIHQDDAHTDIERSLIRVLFVKKGDKQYLSPLNNSRLNRLIDRFFSIPCSIVPTDFVSADDLAMDWDRILFSEHVDIVKSALKHIENDFEDIAFPAVTSDRQPPQRQPQQRTAKVKVVGSSRQIPLNSMGDGMLRVLQLALKIFPAKGGFLLIDEFENGLHYSVQEKIWSLIFDQAEKLNIQVFATTHSWDCIESFARVAEEKTDIPGVLFRVGKSAKKSDYGDVIATVFEKDALFNIKQSDVDIR